jgi:hypothetical protein
MSMVSHPKVLRISATVFFAAAAEEHVGRAAREFGLEHEAVANGVEGLDDSR